MPLSYRTELPLMYFNADARIDYTVNDTQKATYVLIGSISMIATLFVAITIFSSKKLSSHPQPLIAYISLSECMCIYHTIIAASSPTEVSCYFRLDKLVQWVTLIEDSYEAQIFLCQSNKMFFFFFQLLTLFLNISLSIDLIMTMRDPFSPGKRRMKFYLIGSLVASFVIVWAQMVNIKCSPINCDTHLPVPGYDEHMDGIFSTQSANLIMITILSLNILIGFYSCAFAMTRLSKKGVNESVRKYFINKHMTYVFMFIIVWTLNMGGAYHALYSPKLQNGLTA